VKVFGHGSDEPGNEINTMPSFARVRATGADGVELDVRRTADDRLAVWHDALIGDGRAVAEVPFEAVGPRVPSLERVLDACRGLVVNIEIKNFPRDPAFDPAQRVTDLVLDLLDARGGVDDVLISCFDAACLQHCAARRPELATALLFLSRRPAGQLLDIAATGGFRVVHPYDTMVDETFIHEARVRDLNVNVWTGEDDSPRRFTELAALGVDGVITSAPEIAVAVRDAEAG
jgi:glycerophosphoryl diester phosphodiesterase